MNTDYKLDDYKLDFLQNKKCRYTYRKQNNICTVEGEIIRLFKTVTGHEYLIITGILNKESYDYQVVVSNLNHPIYTDENNIVILEDKNVELIRIRKILEEMLEKL